MPDAGACDIHVAALEHLSLIGVLTAADTEVQRSPKDDSQLFIFLVAVDERADGTIVNPPKTQLEVVALDYPTPKARPIGLLEGTVIQEVHVPQVVCHHSPVRSSDEMAEHPALHVGEVLTRDECSLLLATGRDGRCYLVMTLSRTGDDLVDLKPVGTGVEEGCKRR